MRLEQEVIDFKIKAPCLKKAAIFALITPWHND
jgi:hypothetical protein